MKTRNMFIASARVAAFAVPVASVGQAGPVPKPKFDSESATASRRRERMIARRPTRPVLAPRAATLRRMPGSTFRPGPARSWSAAVTSRGPEHRENGVNAITTEEEMIMSMTAATSSVEPLDATGIRARIASIRSLLGRVPLSVHQLLFRLAVAGVFFRTGLQKARGWETTVAL